MKIIVLLINQLVVVLHILYLKRMDVKHVKIVSCYFKIQIFVTQFYKKFQIVENIKVDLNVIYVKMVIILLLLKYVLRYQQKRIVYRGSKKNFNVRNVNMILNQKEGNVYLYLNIYLNFVRKIIEMVSYYSLNIYVIIVYQIITLLILIKILFV